MVRQLFLVLQLLSATGPLLTTSSDNSVCCKIIRPPTQLASNPYTCICAHGWHAHGCISGYMPSPYPPGSFRSLLFYRRLRTLSSVQAARFIFARPKQEQEDQRCFCSCPCVVAPFVASLCATPCYRCLSHYNRSVCIIHNSHPNPFFLSYPSSFSPAKRPLTHVPASFVGPRRRRTKLFIIRNHHYRRRRLLVAGRRLPIMVTDECCSDRTMDRREKQQQSEAAFSLFQPMSKVCIIQDDLKAPRAEAAIRLRLSLI